MPINIYGDEFRPNSNHGIDVSSQRADDLDMRCLAHIGARSEISTPKFLDLGAGRCGFSNRVMIRAPKAEVVAVDMANYAESAASGVQFVHSDILSFLVDQPAESFDVIYSQRTLHYLLPEKAKQVLLRANFTTQKNGRLFLSASGLNSELGTEYPHAHKAWPDRFSRLSREMSEKHGIHEPVCLYTENDLVNLCNQTGWKVLAVWSSAFGNCKLIGEK